ncbi:MAG: flagellar basal body rod protein FlgB [Ruminococcus sp.]|nr:flagellar basal body rod protein FlgB [Ruminococcus sp.]
MSLFGGAAFTLTEEGLDAAWYKQQVISHNLANVSTPDYKAKTVNFGLVLKEKSKCRYHDHTDCPYDSDNERKSDSPVWVTTTYETNTRQILNGNNVDVEKEAKDLSDTQYQYNTMIDYLNSQYAMIRMAINK